MRSINLRCSCGGTTTVNVALGETTAVAECACGKVLLWSEDKGVEIHVKTDTGTAPATLGISVGDVSKASEKFGG